MKILMNSLFGVLGSPASPALLAGGRERDHDGRPARHPARRGRGRAAGPPRHLRRHRLALRRRRRARPGPARPSAAESLRETIGADVADALRARVRRAEPPRARVREGLRALLHARGARAARPAARSATPAWSSARPARRSRSSGSRPCGATGARSRAASSASCSSSRLPRPARRRLRPRVRRRAARRPLRRRAGLPEGGPEAAGESYTKTTPPHVKAARKQAGGPGASSPTW